MNPLLFLAALSLAISGGDGLALDWHRTNDMVYSFNGSQGVYEITTTGGDPYVFTDVFSRDIPSGDFMLTFEYRAAVPVNDVQIYLVSGWNGISDTQSAVVKELPASPGWRTFSYSLKKEFSKYSWGKKGDCLRFDFGNSKGMTMLVRNIHFREMNASEAVVQAKADRIDAAKEKMAADLEDYLQKEYSSTVNSVEVTGGKVTVQGSVSGDGPFALAEVTPWQEVTEMSEFPYTVSVHPENASFSIVLDRFVKGREGIDYDRAFSKWAVVRLCKNGTMELDSHARYADSVPAKSSPEPLKLKNKKGVGAGGNDPLYISDFDSLGLGSITTNVFLSSILDGRGETFEYVFGGKAYRFSKSFQDSYDFKLREAARRGIVVSAIILSPLNSPMADPECNGGYYSMPNLTTAEAFNRYAAALDYLASRYNGGEHGRISHWIMHNEVDFGKIWSNMGEQPLGRFLDRYVKSMRVCFNIVRQYDQNASILESYTHSWTGGGDYAVKTMLEKTVKYSLAEGDFLWGVACHPYPQDLTAPEFWKDDTKATFSPNSEFVTFKNLEVIDSWIRGKAHWYKGERKRVLFLSEQGTNSPSYSDHDLALQAAGACWAWKKVQALDGIDAMQWHGWIDSRGEFGLRIGLRRYPDDETCPSGAKPVWRVWQAAGTDREDEIFAPYLKVIGIGSWNDIIAK